MSFIEVRVLEASGSTPRRPCTRMRAGAGETRGTTGGGNLECIALEIAREMLASGETERQRRFVLGDSLGQCCGGNTTLAFKRVETMEGEVGLFDVVLFGAS